ncbi:MAG: hypothetical protein NZ700_11210 [Gemmataceae bacterium]|nr:hypothetical protein [Gemmataceae bacterium]MDW8267111.1 hypothetical protein [Gemmataceae bacterium]
MDASPQARNVVWAVVANVLAGATNWAIVVVLARLGTAEMVGQYTLGMALITPLALLTDLHLRAALATDFQRQFTVGDYLRLRLVTAGLLLAAAAGAVGLGGYAGPTAVSILLLALARAIDSVSDLTYGAFQRERRMAWAARSQLLRSLLSLLGLVGAVSATRSTAWGMAALGAARLLVLLGHDLPLAGRRGAAWAAAGRSAGGGPRLLQLARLAGLTLPLGLVTMLVALNTSLPVLAVQAWLGEADAGRLGVLLSLPAAIGLVAQAAGQAASPHLAAAWNRGDAADFSRQLRRLVLATAGNYLLTHLYGRDYGHLAPLLASLTVALTIDYAASFLGWGILATRRFQLYPAPYLVTTATCLVATAFWVPRYGLGGAAAAMTVTNIVSFSVLALLVRWQLTAFVTPRTSPAPAEKTREGNLPPG